MKSILDPSFRYTPSFDTDLHKTFARIRSDYRQEAEKAVRAQLVPVPGYPASGTYAARAPFLQTN